MSNKNEHKITGAIMQLCVMLLTAVGTNNCMKAVASIKKKHKALLTDGDFNFLSMNAGAKVLDLIASDKKQTPTWMRYLANMLSKVVGKTFYTLTGSGGFNKSHEKNTAVAILKHFNALIDDNGNYGFNLPQFQALTALDGDFANAVRQALTPADTDEEVEDEVDFDDEDDDEFSEFEEVAVSDNVTSFDVLSAEARVSYPLAGLLMSFFEMIKTCGSATGTILNFKHITNALGKIKSWRPSAKDAIANGDNTYRNGKGQLKEIKCITSYVDDGTPFHLSTFGYGLATEIVLKCLNFNFNNKKAIFYDMKDTYMGKDIKKALGFVTGGLRLIMNAVDNGAPKSEIGVGFSQYIDAKDIYALVDAYTTNGDFYGTYANRGSVRDTVVIDESFDDVLV